ncbi:hypothetical protein FACS1894174_08680 [Bacteroidia bacterium]|nr:hypothetical protein FACS189455_3810 [Bacteroidia bacterium]GHV23156.1 hypothetical protein FACS1894174_08680 [Bacteroidia bacterium]
MDNTNKQQELPDDNKVVFVPAEDIRSIEHVLERMEQVQQGIRKVTEKMKPLDSDNEKS